MANYNCPRKVNETNNFVFFFTFPLQAFTVERLRKKGDENTFENQLFFGRIHTVMPYAIITLSVNRRKEHSREHGMS